MSKDYVATGFKRGRPRIGEIRPSNKNALRMKAYRQKRLSDDPSWKENLAKQYRDWVAKNPDRIAMITKLSNQRKQLRLAGWHLLSATTWTLMQESMEEDLKINLFGQWKPGMVIAQAIEEDQSSSTLYLV